MIRQVRRKERVFQADPAQEAQQDQQQISGDGHGTHRARPGHDNLLLVESAVDDTTHVG